MNRDRRDTPKRREYRLRVPAGVGPAKAAENRADPADLAPWILAAVRAWPRTVEDRLVAVRMGVGLRQVQLARGHRPAA